LPGYRSYPVAPRDGFRFDFARRAFSFAREHAPIRDALCMSRRDILHGSPMCKRTRARARAHSRANEAAFRRGRGVARISNPTLLVSLRNRASAAARITARAFFFYFTVIRPFQPVAHGGIPLSRAAKGSTRYMFDIFVARICILKINRDS